MMIKKSILIVIFGILLLGCESDVVQGGCPEDFVELPGPDGLPSCTPLSDMEAINETVPN
jgi:hypothetical protein